MTFLEDYPEYLSHLTTTPVNYPTAINIELTTYCNLKCIMCPKTAGFARTPPNRSLNEEILAKLIAEVFPKIARIDLVGDGEILIELQMLGKILHAARMHGILVNASTNGILMDEKSSKVLVHGHLHDLNISIDAATAQTYSAIRLADFNVLIENIKKLNQIKKDLRTPYPFLHFSMVGMKKNIHELPLLINLAKELQANSVTLQAMGEFAAVKSQSIFLRDKKLGREYFEKAKVIGEKYGITVDLWPQDQFDESDEPRSEDINDRDQLRKDCNFPWDVPYISTEGAIRPCCAMPPMGDLNRESFDAIWQGESYNQLRKSIHSPNPHKTCVSCPGRGWFHPTQCATFLKSGQNDRQLGLGWFELERDGEELFHWARSHSTLFFAGSTHPFCSIDIAAASEAGAAQSISLTLDSQNEKTFVFSPAERRTLHIPIDDADRELHILKFTASSWRPADVIPESLDSRRLSFKFYSLSSVGIKANARFANGMHLQGYEAPAVISRSKECLSVSIYLNNLSSKNLQFRPFFHIFKSRNSHRISKTAIFFHEFLRKAVLEQRFQLDAPLSSIGPLSDVFRLNFSIPKNFDLGYGIYQLFFGMTEDSGQRIGIENSSSETYRNSYRLNSFEVVE